MKKGVCQTQSFLGLVWLWGLDVVDVDFVLGHFDSGSGFF